LLRRGRRCQRVARWSRFDEPHGRNDIATPDAGGSQPGSTGPGPRHADSARPSNGIDRW